MIPITTAGKVGSEAARLLAQRREPVRVLARDPGKATELTQAGVEVAKGDLEMPATIDAAMHGISGDSDWITDDVPSILGRPQRTFEQFATDHAAAFS